MLEGKPLFPGKDRKSNVNDYFVNLNISRSSFILFVTIYLDVNQFSIITELLGTPPDDVIQTICSENVYLSSSDFINSFDKKKDIFFTNLIQTFRRFALYNLCQS